MASICHSISLPSTITKLRPIHPFLPHSTSTLSLRSCKIQASTSKSSTAVGDAREPNEGSMSIDNLYRFFEINSGKWNGSFFQYDVRGNLLHEISTKLAVSSYGEDELISLIQTLYIKQKSSVSLPRNDDEPEWAEYKIKETNMFTVDKYQQIGFFPNEKAFSLRYQTAGMLDTVLREGVLGEDDTGEEFPKNLKLPSRRPSIVCENCLYIPDRDLRARAFHIMDPQGIIEMLLVFLEERTDGKLFHRPLNSNSVSDEENRLLPFLGDWKGHSRTKRSGVYGATIAEADSFSSLQMDDNGQIIQDITTTSMNEDVTTNVHWTGTKLDNLVTFDGGYQITLLPGGMYMGCPCDVAKSVADNKSFHLEFCWLEAPGKRQRLVRTYDVEGLAVSSTYFSEIKL
ncbi:uncharacterized protein LOC101202842 [Cucumis sativus]|uniref:Uncharacterized protein n=1 Tax=Cucumis sativus TaxID=3659 RepID=A0A0A0KXI1_CUCSA|nr:uncharacterized protein LOC101202842 [Cucumis sativus]KGN52491.1 hypothetical protein Csa_007970 [Cucumis sativus]